VYGVAALALNVTSISRPATRAGRSLSTLVILTLFGEVESLKVLQLPCIDPAAISLA
jgi:hypothetical protein